MRLSYQHSSVGRLVDAGFSLDDAMALRRISMTLHRWHELECGDSNAHSSWCLVRGFYNGVDPFSYDEEKGVPYLEIHHHMANKPQYRSLQDRERGALKRLAKIMKRYPGFQSYVQGDPRGCALYLVPKTGLFHADPSPEYLSANYTRGIAVHR